jgi:hypothetical protein
MHWVDHPRAWLDLGGIAGHVRTPSLAGTAVAPSLGCASDGVVDVVAAAVVDALRVRTPSGEGRLSITLYTHACASN